MYIYWIDKQRFAGGSEPQLTDVPFLKNIDLAGMVALTEKPNSKEIAGLLDLLYLHVPLIDYSIPSEKDLNKIYDFILDVQEKRPKLPVLIHCSSGLGRTGTILAALLVLIDKIPPKDAIRRIREINPLAIETLEQENFILTFNIMK